MYHYSALISGINEDAIHTQNTLRTLYLSRVSDSINIQLNPHTITARENRFYENKCSVRETPGGQKNPPHGRKSELGPRHDSFLPQRKNRT